MYKILIVFKKTLVLIFSFFIYANSYAADNLSVAKDNASLVQDTKLSSTKANAGENYYVGLKAFNDGLYDVAKLSFEEFLKTDANSKQAGFAKYLLYQVDMALGDFENAKRQFDGLSAFSDDRFDRRKMENDKMYIISKLNCDEARALLLSKNVDDWVKIYNGNACPIDENIVEYVAAGNFSDDTLALMMEKLKNDTTLMLKIYASLPKEKKTPKMLNFYGKFFAQNKMRKEFWTLFNEYKDSDIMTLAFAEVWESGDYVRYVDMFNSDMKSDFKLPQNAYCRMIEASNKTSGKFNCDVVDSCLGTNHIDFKKTKLACYMKNEDKDGLSEFMKQVSIADAKNLCEYARYIVGKQLYNINFIDKFSVCSDKSQMYETLFGFKDGKALEKLVGKPKSDIDYAYLALAGYLNGKTLDYNSNLSKIKEPSVINMVKEKTGRK